MKKTILWLTAALLAALCLAFVACKDTPAETTPAETTPATDASTDAPTDVSTEEPTDAPTDSPTDAPVDQPTEEPTEEPTEPPTEDPNAPIYMMDAEYIAQKANKPDDPFTAWHIAFAATVTEDDRTYTRIAACGDDPYIALIPLGSDMYLTDYLVISYRNNSRFPGEFYLGSGGGWTGSGDNFNANWKTDNEWDLMIVDLTTCGVTSIVDNIITYTRIDIFRGETTEDEWFDIEFVAFFETPEQAVAYYEARHGKLTNGYNDNSVVTPLPEIPEEETNESENPEEGTTEPEQPKEDPDVDTSEVTFGDYQTAITVVSSENVDLYSGDSVVAANTVDWVRQNGYSITVDGITHVSFAGWVNPVDGIEIASFGYQIDDEAPVFNTHFSGIPSDPDSSALQGALGDQNAERYTIKIPVDQLTEGTHTLSLLVKDTNGVAYRIDYWWHIDAVEAMTFVKTAA